MQQRFRSPVRGLLYAGITGGSFILIPLLGLAQTPATTAPGDRPTTTAPVPGSRPTNNAPAKGYAPPQEENRPGRSAAFSPVPGSSPAGSVTPTAGNNPSATGTTEGGTITAFNGNQFSWMASSRGNSSNFVFGPDTLFIDITGRTVSREQFTSQGPVTVSYMQSGNERVATRVVATPPPPQGNFAIGTMTTMGPGVLVIALDDKSSKSVSFVANKTTSFISLEGNAVPPHSIATGTPVKIFYSKVGTNFIAATVQVQTR